jgi:hypothetical protein
VDRPDGTGADITELRCCQALSGLAELSTTIRKYGDVFGRRAFAPHAHLLQAAAGILPLGVDLFGLAFLALVRCRSLEQSRYLSPGERGKLLGLDRMPEVKTLRRKISEDRGANPNHI